MPRSITIPDVDDATATWLVEEAGTAGDEQGVMLCVLYGCIALLY